MEVVLFGVTLNVMGLGLMVQEALMMDQEAGQMKVLTRWEVEEEEEAGTTKHYWVEADKARGEDPNQRTQWARAAGAMVLKWTLHHGAIPKL